MIANLIGGTGWSLVAQIDIVSQCILVSLFVLSVLCCTIFIAKIISLARRQAQAVSILKQVEKAETLLEVRATAMALSSSEGKDLLLIASAGQKDDPARPIACERQVDNMTMCDERATLVLGVSAAVSPLVGLFGTVWGLIHALIGIGAAGSADLSMIAPGIAEALLTTLAGLIVAIPALIFSQVLAWNGQRLELLWFAISDRAQALVDRV